MKKIKSVLEKIKVYVKSNKGTQALLLAIANVFLIYYMLELGNKNLLMNGPLFTVVNILTLFIPVAVIYLFTQRWWISTSVIALPLTVLSIANNYTIMFRNSPISTQDIFNARTAMSVMGSYKFTLNFYIIGIILLFAAIIFISVLLFKLEKGKKYEWKKILIKDLCIILFFSAFTYATYLAKNPIKPRSTFVWSWEETYYKYGYTATSIEVLQTSLAMVTKPDSYSESTLEAEVSAKVTPSKGQHNPDIIYILNETFYDLGDLVDLGDTPSPTPFIDSLPDSQKGRVVVSGTGGGTNKSEYELLTSNSLQLMPGITPFNFLDFNQANSIVSHLESQGYSTWAGHCAESLNYSRSKVYPQLGFDEIMFDTDFGTKELYGNRYYATDEFCYAKMLEHYETMGNGPRFMYLLTIQNHGNWDLNPDEKDTIKVAADFGDYTDDVSEFLSCIHLSDTSFKALTEYFENIDRDVIICMVGDHCPSIATNLIDNVDEEKTFALRSTPYVIWANFELDRETELPDVTSMPFVSSMVLDAADVPASPFYSYMSQLRKDVPVLTSFSLYRTADGATHNYDDKTPYTADINTYFNMVYNNASPDAKRNQKIFDVYK